MKIVILKFINPFKYLDRDEFAGTFPDPWKIAMNDQLLSLVEKKSFWINGFLTIFWINGKVNVKCIWSMKQYIKEVLTVYFKSKNILLYFLYSSFEKKKTMLFSGYSYYETMRIVFQERKNCKSLRESILREFENIDHFWETKSKWHLLR